MGHPVQDTNEQVLSTLNADGSRRWIRPKLAKGPWYRARLIVGWVLMALFVALPHIPINGKPAMLLDIVHRRFTLFGTTFHATDTFFLMLLLVGIFVSIFLLTALLGRVWCGWGCPQTVYMEFLYRPLEKLIEGDRSRQLKLDREGGDWRRVVKLVVFIVPSAILANSFIAYFAGAENVLRWMTGSPFQHPTAFLIMAGTTALMYVDFAFFREQTCLVACPYGRFQSVLLDRSSLIVAYDPKRGEPRVKAVKRARVEAPGDCVDCGACVSTCPTGIDIRNGLQMECIHCTQCIDACDEMMDRFKLPRGLIRYTSQEELETGRRRFLRPRVVLYPLVLLVVFGLLGVSLARRSSADVTVLRGIGTPFTIQADGNVANQLRVVVVNRAEQDREYTVELVNPGPFKVVSPQNPFPLKAGETTTTQMFVIGPPSAFAGSGVLDIEVRVHDSADFDKTFKYRLLGPAGE